MKKNRIKSTSNYLVIILFLFAHGASQAAGASKFVGKVRVGFNRVTDFCARLFTELQNSDTQPLDDQRDYGNDAGDFYNAATDPLAPQQPGTRYSAKHFRAQLRETLRLERMGIILILRPFLANSELLTEGVHQDSSTSQTRNYFTTISITDADIRTEIGKRSKILFKKEEDLDRIEELYEFLNQIGVDFDALRIKEKKLVFEFIFSLYDLKTYQEAAIRSYLNINNIIKRAAWWNQNQSVTNSVAIGLFNQLFTWKSQRDEQDPLPLDKNAQNQIRHSFMSAMSNTAMNQYQFKYDNLMKRIQSMPDSSDSSMDFLRLLELIKPLYFNAIEDYDRLIGEDPKLSFMRDSFALKVIRAIEALLDHADQINPSRND